MSAKKLIDFFSMCERAPTPLADVRDQIKSIYNVDNIQFVPFVEGPDDLLGMLVKWTHTWSYGDTTSHCAVCYNETVDPWMQRLICCKEMINIFDDPSAVTKSREDVNGLLDGLLGIRANFTITNVFDIQTFFDELAIGQALAVIYPLNFLAKAKQTVDSGEKTTELIASEIKVPTEFAEFLLSPKWYEQAGRIIASS